MGFVPSGSIWPTGSNLSYIYSMKKGMIIFFLLCSLISRAQEFPFSLTISFKRISPASYIKIFRPGSTTVDNIPYPANDTLHYSGKHNQPGPFQIATDVVPSYPFWVDSFPVKLALKEEKTKLGNKLFRIDSYEGSADGSLYLKMTEPTSFSIKLPVNSTAQERDSISKAYRFTFFYNIIDSLFTAYPASQVIPYYIRLYEKVLGPEAVSHFYYRLNESLQNNETGLKIRKFLEQSVMLKKGVILENFSMKTPANKKFKLKNVHAKYILIEFWASWCLPCRAQNPSLVKIYDQYKDKGFSIVGVSLDRNKKDWLDAIQKDGLKWDQVSELNGWSNSLAKKYKVSSVPFTILLDSHYQVVETSLHTGNLGSLLDKLLR